MVGVGQLGGSLLDGLLHAGVSPDRLTVATRNPAHAAELAARHGVQAAPATQAVADADIVVLAARVPQMVAVLDEIGPSLAPDAVVISLAGGPDHATLADHLPAGTAIVRAMPMPSMAVGAGATGFCPADGCPPEAAERARSLLAQVGDVIDISEDRIGIFGSLVGHAQAVVHYAADAALQWGVLNGLSREESRELVALAVARAGQTLVETRTLPSVQQHRLSTPAGSTIRSMAELDAAGVRGAIITCMDGGRFKA